MPKYRVLKSFRDIHTKEIYKPNMVIEMTVKRANEAIKNLSKYGGDFLERIDEKKQEEGD